MQATRAGTWDVRGRRPVREACALKAPGRQAPVQKPRVRPRDVLKRRVRKLELGVLGAQQHAPREEEAAELVPRPMPLLRPVTLRPQVTLRPPRTRLQQRTRLPTPQREDMVAARTSSASDLLLR